MKHFENEPDSFSSYINPKSLNDLQAAFSTFDLGSLGLSSLGGGRYKVDLTTKLESFLIFLMVFTGLGAILALSSVSSHPGLLVIAIVLFIISFALYWMTDNYYIVDTRNKVFLYHFHCAHVDFDRIVAPFKQIMAFSTTCVRRHRKSSRREKTYYGERRDTVHRYWMEYAAVAVLTTGQILPVSDFRREKLEACNQLAEKLAELTQTSFVQGLPNCMAVAKRDHNGNMVVKQEQYGLIDRLFDYFFWS